MEDQPFDSGFPVPSGVPVTPPKRDVWQSYAEAGLHVAEDHSAKSSSSGVVTDRERCKRTLA